MSRSLLAAVLLVAACAAGCKPSAAPAVCAEDEGGLVEAYRHDPVIALLVGAENARPLPAVVELCSQGGRRTAFTARFGVPGPASARSLYATYAAALDAIGWKYAAGSAFPGQSVAFCREVNGRPSVLWIADRQSGPDTAAEFTFAPGCPQLTDSLPLRLAAAEPVPPGTPAAVRRWKQPLGTPVQTPPVMAGGTLVVGAAGWAFGLNPAAGAVQWRVRLPDAVIGLVADATTAYASLGRQGALVALDGRTGALRWAAASRAGLDDTDLAVDGGHVFGPGTGGGLAAWRTRDGVVDWRTDQPPGHVAAGDGVVYTGRDTPMAAYDARTGRLRWRSRVGHDLEAVATAPGVVYACSRTRLTAERPADGRVIWGADQPGCGRDLALTDRALYASGPRLRAFDRRTGRLLWESVAVPVWSRLAAAPGLVLCRTGSGSGLIAAVDTGDGGVAWMASTPDTGVVEPGVLAADGLVYAAGSSGTVLAFAPPDPE